MKRRTVLIAGPAGPNNFAETTEMTTDEGPRTTDKPLAIVLASGGMDSCVTTAIANLNYRLAMLHVAYGQRTEARECRAFNAVAALR